MIESRTCVECHTTVPSGGFACPSCGCARLATVRTARGSRSVSIVRAAAESVDRVHTLIPGLDRVLGGGGVRRSVVLVSGEPGIGKSTLLLQAAHRMARAGRVVLIASAEESQGQIGARAKRIDALHPNLLLLAGSSMDEVRKEVASERPSVVIVDSAQAFGVEKIGRQAVGGAPGSMTQVLAVARVCVEIAKAYGCFIVLVGQVTKDDLAAGPRQMEHLVDAHLSFGQEQGGARYIRSGKNRYGASGEYALFEMGAKGLVEIADATGALLADLGDEPGSVLFPAAHLAKPALTLVEARVGEDRSAADGAARRVCLGLPEPRFRLLLTQLRTECGVALDARDVYVSVATLADTACDEPGVDLAVAAALLSSHFRRPVPPSTCVLGAIGLSGRVRLPPRGPQRLEEAKARGLRRAIGPTKLDALPGLEVVRVGHLRELPGALFGEGVAAIPGGRVGGA